MYLQGLDITEAILVKLTPHWEGLSNSLLFVSGKLTSYGELLLFYGHCLLSYEIRFLS